MLLEIPGLLGKDRVSRFRAALASAEWTDGRVTAGHQSARTKRNRQLPEGSPIARELGEDVMTALSENPLFVSAALPLKVFPPLFNRYDGGDTFGSHVDNAVRQIPGSPLRIRTDLSATLFLADPASYDGGELCIRDTYGDHSVKLPAGHLVLYPASSLHLVTPVTRGSRLASFFWIQSMVRDDAQRTLLLDLDLSIQRIAHGKPDHPEVIRLTGIYHNLLRLWSET